MNPNVRFAECSVGDARELEVVAEGLSLGGACTASISLVRIEDDDTELSASWGMHVEPEEPLRIAAPPHLELPPGLYGLAQVSLTPTDQPEGDTEGTVRLSEEHYGLQLVEIRHEDAPSVGREQLQTRFEEIMAARHEEFMAGVGLDEGAPDVREYMVVVFVKDCLLTQPMRLGRYEVQPVGGLPAGDEVALVQDCLRALTADEIPDRLARDTAESKKGNHPCFLVHFPVVRATSEGDAAAMADTEARVLCSVLSLHRLAYPTPFAAFAKDLTTKSCRVWILGRDYGGNLAGGGMSGEYPAGIRANVARAKSDERIRLLLSLHRDALLEAEPESQYFRLWSLLEIMASHDVGNRDPILDWDGLPRRNSEGKDLTIADRGASAQVFEYLRRCLCDVPVDFNYRQELDQHTWEELVAVWYQHRICMVHGGGCAPENPSLCRPRSDRRRACREAHDEMLEKHGSSGIDRYRSALRDIAGFCLARELGRCQ